MNSSFPTFEKAYRPLICGAKLVAISLLISVLATSACGQNSQFGFDPHGNLLIQTSETVSSPQILSQPQMQVVQPGQLASFFVVAADTRGLAYQWLFNGTNLPGAASDTLLMTNISAANQGPYSVVLTNISGSVTSSVAQLYIDSRGVGMPDSWRLQYFGNLNQNPTADFDGDGINNLQEFLDGTNPTNSGSALYRLTILNNGGQVDVSPNQPAYTNGQVVTLTATAFAPNSFRGWAGDISSTNNPATVTMTTNKTVFAYLGSLNLTWTNASAGDWNVPTNWSPNFVPSPNDNVFINRQVTVSMNNSAECASLTLGPGSAPTLAITGSLTLDGPSYWFTGTLSGSGRTIIGPASTLTIDNPSSVYVTSGTLENDGTIVCLGANDLILNSAFFTNAPGALFNVQNAASLSGSSSRFDNAGTFRKSANSGTSTVSVQFNNFGTVDIQTGTLLCNNSTFVNSGSVVLAAGTTNRMAGGGSATGSFTTPATALSTWTGTAFTPAFTLSPGVQLNGAGLYRVDGTTVNFNTDLTVQNVDVALVSGSGGTTLGGSGTLTISNVMNWLTGGSSMSGTGTTVIAPGAALNVGNSFTLSRTLENGGTINWTNGVFSLNSAVITNRAGAFFNAQSANTLGSSGSRIDNAGTFRKSVAPGTTLVQAAFNNYATIDLQTGTLQINANFLNTGVVTLAPGTTNQLTGSGSASGSFTAPASAVVLVSGNGFLPAFNLNPGVQFLGAGLYQLIGGTVSLNTDLAVQNLDFNTALSGNGTLTVSNVMNWFAGASLNGNGVNSLVIPAGATLNLVNSGSVFFNSRTLDNGGTVSWSGSGGMQMSGAIITNRAGALFQIQNGASISGSGRFDNVGVFRKSITAGASSINVPFNNYSTVDLQTGGLTFSGGGANIAGTVTVVAGATFSLGNNFTSDGTSSITGAGNLTVSGGTAALAGLINLSGTNSFNGGTANLTGNYICTNNMLNIFGTANFDGTGTVSPAVVNLGGLLGGANSVTVGSLMNWTGGTMSGTGRTLIASGATMNIASPTFTITLTSRTLENAGTIVWTGGGGCYLTSAVITNRPGALFDAQNATSLFGTSGRFDNAGTFRKEINSGTTTMDNNVALNNYGTIDIRTGIVAANHGYASSSSALLNCALGGTAAGTSYGQLQVAGTVNLAGSLSVNLLPGYAPATNDAFTVVSAGTRNGTFANFSYPANRVAMQLSNTPTSVVLLLTNVFPVPQPVLLTPLLSGSNALVTWTATSNITYRLEFKPDFGATNWLALPGDVTTFSSTASKLDQLTTSNRFYRVHVLP